MNKHRKQHYKEQNNTVDSRTFKILTTINRDRYFDEGWQLDKNGLSGHTRRSHKSWKNYRNKQYK